MTETVRRTTCPRCGITTAATIIAKGERHGELISQPSLQSYFCKCTGCEREFLLDSYLSLSKLGSLTTVEALTQTEDLNQKLSWEIGFPIEFVAIPEAVPPPVCFFYFEATKALNCGLPNAAGAMFRKALDVATVESSITCQLESDTALAVYNKKSLYLRLAELKKAGIIPPAIHRLVDTIRLEGNVATHDNDTYTIKEADALRLFVDSLLMQLFTIPAKLDQTRSSSTTLGSK